MSVLVIDNFGDSDLTTGSEDKVCGTKMAKAKGSDKTAKLCRLCGKLKADVISIFSAKGAALQLREKLEHLLRITVTDGDKLPKHVCDKCVVQLNMCDSVMEFFKQTQSSLQKVLNVEAPHEEAPALAPEPAPVPVVSEKEIPNVPDIVEPQISAEPAQTISPKEAPGTEDDFSDIQGTNNTEFDPSTLDDDVLFSMHGIKVTLPIPCDFCGEIFDNLESFDVHIANHKEQRVFSCQLCSNTYVSWNNLVAHRKACHGGDVLACDKCSARTYHPDLIPVNYAVKDFPVGCEECDEGFNSIVELCRHYRVSLSHLGTGISQDQVMCSTNDNWNEVGTNNEDRDTGSVQNVFPVNSSAAETEAHDTNMVEDLQSSTMCVDFVCSLCGGQFPTSEVLDQHIAKMQDEASGLSCTPCDMKFCDKDMFAAHQQLHSSNYNHISHKDLEETSVGKNQDNCESYDASNRKHFTDTNTSPSKEEFACFDCSITYANLWQLETHVNTMHSSCKAVTCDVCKKRFGANIFICHYVECLVSKNNDQNILQLHRKNCSKCSSNQAQASESKQSEESNSAKNVHTGEVCLNQIDRPNVVSHARSRSPDESNAPDKYKEMIKLTGSKKQQNQSHHGQQESCRCEHCGKVLVNKQALLAHVRLHTKASGHVCLLCNKAFVTEKHLMVHVLRHTNEQAHECEQCFKVFTSAESLKVHKTSHTGLYTCHHCDKTLSGRMNYLGHVRLHTGERPYKCTHCSRAFTLQQRLKLHVKLKHGSSASSDDSEYDFDDMDDSEGT